MGKVVPMITMHEERAVRFKNAVSQIAIREVLAGQSLHVAEHFPVLEPGHRHGGTRRSVFERACDAAGVEVRVAVELDHLSYEMEVTAPKLGGKIQKRVRVGLKCI